MNSINCLLSMLPRPIVELDGPMAEISPAVKAMAMDFLRKGTVPDRTRTLADYEFVANLVQLGALRLDHESMTAVGIEPVEHPRLIADRLITVVGPSSLKRIRKALASDAGLSFDDLLREEQLPFEVLPELLVGLFAAEGGLSIADTPDDCSVEERTELRRRNSDAITDWARAESGVIVANFENGVDGLQLFVNYLNMVGQSVESGIGGPIAAGGEAVLWLFGVDVPLAGAALALIARTVASSAAGVSNARTLEEGLRGFELVRNRANEDLDRKVRELRNEIIAAGNNCPLLRQLLMRNENLPRTATTTSQEVYLALLVAWGRGRYGDDLTPPNPRRANADLRDKWILYGGYSKNIFGWDGYELVDEINRVMGALKK